MPRPVRKAPRKITPGYLHNAGLHYLGRFAASRAKFTDVMLRKIHKSCKSHQDQDFAACARMLEELADKFERSGLLNDKAYAEGLASSLRRAGKSKKAIMAKLAVKGLDSGLAANALKTCDAETENAELTAARAFVKKKRLLDKDREKSLAALSRAGFSYDVSRKALEGEDS